MLIVARYSSTLNVRKSTHRATHRAQGIETSYIPPSPLSALCSPSPRHPCASLLVVVRSSSSSPPRRRRRTSPHRPDRRL
ncbi:hypothetical protein EX30DRAFT_208842 [Ascodesmis nigricans]|uniref:Uncharacterized protein n=1 Tax=Ascodesmis nigricans TaxID=341454 RepID=A0A4S2MJP6_9PEZI|nr:hypothetical protein EX30DRAFT_208842 [Ascodesmis nigricans]